MHSEKIKNMKTSPNTAIQRAVDNGKKRALFLAFASSFCILHSASMWAQGTLTPSGAPAPGMKTLQQIEPRTPIASLPFTISSPGSYYLTTNITTTGAAITIVNTMGVTLDLNGFTISSTAPSPTGTGVLISGTCSDIQIFNGHIIGSVTNNSNGVYSGTGFAYGITYFTLGPQPANVRVAGVSVSGCLYYGIYLGENSTVVESCMVKTVGSSGIYATSVSRSSAHSCGDTAINAHTASDCYGYTFGTATGLSAYTANNCYGLSSGGNGLLAQTANNCQGSGAGTGYGLNAETANNCEGSAGTGDGLDTTTANNCFGQSSSGNGISASTATGCNGSSSLGYALSAYTATGCTGSSAAGYGIYASVVATGCGGSSTSGNGLYALTANNCTGQSSSGTGLSAFIASGCHGSSSSGPPLNVTHNINSF